MDNDKDFQLLESILLENGQYFILDKHLKRLQSSASFFNFYYNEEEVRKKLLSLSTSLAKGGYKVRLLLSAQGEIIVESEEIEKTTGIKKVRLAEEPIDQKNIFHYYKTTKREIYNKHRHNLNNEIYDVLLWNKYDELTEFTTGNFVYEINNKKYTPPVKSGLLNGTYRTYLIERGEIEERILSRHDLDKVKKLLFINSVRRELEVKLIRV